MIAASSGGGGTGFIFIVVIGLAVLWLLVVRPQKRKQTQAQRMLADLRVDDEVLTAGGVYGRVTRIDEDEVRLEVAPQVEIRVARRAVAAILTEHDAPQAVEAEASEEPEEGDERWRSAFDGEGSDEEKPR